MENHADQDAGAAPQQAAQAGVKEETLGRGTHGARHGGGNSIKTGNELGDDQRLGPPALELVFRLADAIIGRQRDTAEQTQDALAKITASAEPGEIADQA